MEQPRIHLWTQQKKDAMTKVLELVSRHRAAAMLPGQHLPSTAVLGTVVLVVVGTSAPWPRKLSMSV